jgi:hypothetical protein
MMQECERRRAKISTIRGKTISEIIAGTAVELHLRAVPTGDDPKTVVLDLVQPFRCLRAAYRFWLGGTARSPQRGVYAATCLRLSKKLIRALVDTAHALTAIQSLIRFVQKSLVSSKNFELNKLPDGD